MTPNEIIAMAKEAGMNPNDDPDAISALGKSVPVAWLARFAALVAAKERARMAQEFDRRAKPSSGYYEPEEPAQIIRAWDDVPPMRDETFGGDARGNE